MILKFDEFVNESLQSINEDVTVKNTVKAYDDGIMSMNDLTEIEPGETVTLKGMEKYSQDPSDKKVYDVGVITYKGKKLFVSQSTYKALKYLN